MSSCNLTADIFCDIDNTTDMQEPEFIRHVAMGMLVFLSVSGIIGNALVLYVFSRQKQKLSSTIFILTLAGTDLITSLITMPFTIVLELRNFHVNHDAFCKIYQLLTTTTVPFSASVMVAIAVDRYLCIVYPFKHTMTLKRAKISVVVLALCATCIGMPSSLMYGVYANEYFPRQLINGHLYMNNTSLVEETDSSLTLSISMERLYFQNQISPHIHFISSFTNDTKGILYNLRNTGKCHKNFLIVDVVFFDVYQKMYSSYFAVCAVIVIVLYVIIYRSVLMRRRSRLHKQLQGSCCGLLLRRENIDNNVHEQTEFTRLKNTNEKSSTTEQTCTKHTQESLKKDINEHEERYGITLKDINEHEKRYGITLSQSTANIAENDTLVRPRGISRAKMEKLRLANIKTALMLSIVAVTYIIAFLPAWLMALRAIPMNLVVFYMYFVYHVANPIIYAFLNQSFRNHLQSLFKC